MSKHRTHGTLRNRLLSGLLCLALVLGLLPAGTILPVRAASWAEPYGQQLVEWGIMNGDSGGLRLEDTITRAEFVTLINKAFGYDKLGSMPFTDVPSNKWYADEINIAYNAGYFMGRSENIADPDSSLNREEAAVLLARNLMLQPTVGESQGFTDSRNLNEWSRGLISAAVEEGVLSGYGDGSFRPFNLITRGEMASMLVRAIGTPISKEGDYTLGGVYGNVVVSSSNVTLRDTTIAGNLYLTGGIDLGNVLLQNVKVLGRIVVSGAGESNAGEHSVVLRNVVADELVVDSVKDQFVTILAQGVTDIPVTRVRTDAYLDDSADSNGFGLHFIEMLGEGGKLQLAGSIKEVVNKAPLSSLQLVQGSAQTLTVDEYAKNSWVLVDENTRVDKLNLDTASTITGKGDIKNLNVSAGGSTVGKDILPDSVDIRPGVNDTIIGAVDEKEPVSSSGAAQLSASPRLLAGYPKVTDIAPTQAKGVFSANKPGTIYWAVSAVADGSVSVADLISNPAYGGNIFEKQAGKIEVTAANTEYTVNITKLLADGSYYLSAIMVDDRGRQSPLKVVSFSTPDNTKPAFVSTPEMTKVTTDVAQVTATANKNCLLYYVVLPSKAAAPTAQQFKSQSFGANYGSGTVNMVKNLPTSIKVNRSKLQEKTEYYLYLWLTDHEGGAQSMDKPERVIFTTPDETPPIVTGLEQLSPTDKESARINFAINESPATLYWAVVPSGDEASFIRLGSTDDETAEIMSSLSNKMKVEFASQSDVTASGSTPVTAANLDTLFTINGLNVENTNSYTLYYVAKDAAGNYSSQVKVKTIRTRDTTPPTVKYEFTSINGSNEMEPLADSGIKLVFSEVVRGGNDPKNPSFLELYQAVVSAEAAGDTDRADDARKELAGELSDHILLYYVPMDRPGNVLLNTATSDDYGTVDFEKAIVRMEGTSMVVFLPGEKDVSSANGPREIAVALNSGATYYVQLQDIYDVPMESDPANGLNGNRDGNLRMDNFKVVYAQIWLSENDYYPNIPEDETKDPDLKGLRLDMCFDVDPESTAKVPKTEYWDLIIQTDTTVYVELYRCKLKDDEIVGEWELLNEKTPAPALFSANSGKGMGVTILNDHFGVLREDLEEEYTYRYGVHITNLAGTPEGDENKKIDPPSWSGTVNMTFSIIAGPQSGVRTVSIFTDENYDPDSTNGMGRNVNVISQINASAGTTLKELKLERSYEDTRVPDFSTGYPTITAGSGRITMELDLNREGGTIYYVIAPAVGGGSINTGVDAGNGVVKITPQNDGTAYDKYDIDNEDDREEKETAIADNLTGLTYIPMNGWDREYYKKYIAFTSYDASGTEAKKEATSYSAPFFDNVKNPPASWRNNDSIYVGEPVKYDGSTQTEIITDSTFLKASTEYYIYFLIEGVSGNSNERVEIYRVTTTPAKPPYVTMQTTQTSATITANNPEDNKPYEGTELHYAISVMSGSSGMNTLPAIFSKQYYWGTNGKAVEPGDATDAEATYGPKYSVLDAMMYRPSGEQTYFDLYGDVDGIKLKETVREYIMGSESGDLGQAPIHRFGPEDGPSKFEDFAAGKYMTSNMAEYVVLVASRHESSTRTDASSYGFAASRGFYNPDPEPPEFNTKGLTALNGRQLFEANLTGVYATKSSTDNLMDNSTWGSDPNLSSYYFSGTLIIRFDKPIYQAQQQGTGILKAVVAANTVTDTNSQISILDFITTTNGDWSVAGSGGTTAAQTFILEFDKIKGGCQLFMPAEGRINSSNPNSDAQTKALTMTFNASLTEASYDPDVLAGKAKPGWLWSWD